MALMIGLRLIHILAGVFWAGASFFVAGQVWRAVDAEGDAGMVFMERLMLRARGGMALGISGGLTVLAGIGLYWIDSNGFSPAWSSSPTGITLSIGGLAGILAFVLGIMIGVAGGRLGVLLNSSGGAPTPAQAAEFVSVRNRLRLMSRMAAALLGIAVIAMAIARYV